MARIPNNNYYNNNNNDNHIRRDQHQDSTDSYREKKKWKIEDPDTISKRQQEMFRELDEEFDYEGRIKAYRPGFRTGFACILGSPNMGKSTLLNALLQQNLCITTKRPQTTRHAIQGILTTNDTQLCLIDTPGVLENPAYKLQEGMMEAVYGAFHGSDFLLVVSDLFSTPFANDKIFKQIQNSTLPVIVAINKVDLQGMVKRRPKSKNNRFAYFEDDSIWKTYSIPEAVAKWRALLPNALAIIPVSASQGMNHTGTRVLRKLLLAEKDLDAAIREMGRPIRGMFKPGVLYLKQEDVKGLLPFSPPLYDEGDMSDRTCRFFASEYIRETLFETLEKELPYCCEVRIDSYEDPIDDNPNQKVNINATILVERSSQKKIVIGKEASKIMEIRALARKKISDFLQQRVFLSLEIKVYKDWRRREGMLRQFGYLH